MKATSTALAAHLAGPVTTLATCWRITRADGTEFFFTDHDRDLSFEGNVYKASSGYSRTAIANDSSLSVDNLDIEGVFDSVAITEEELRAGLFDQAEVRIFLVNWADPSMGSLRMRRGWFGEVTLSEQGIFRTELRGMTQALSQRIGELYSPECRADLGDHRCKVPILPPEIARSTAYARGRRGARADDRHSRSAWHCRSSTAGSRRMAPVTVPASRRPAGPRSPATGTCTTPAMAACRPRPGASTSKAATRRRVSWPRPSTWSRPVSILRRSMRTPIGWMCR